MTCWLKLPLAPATLVILAACGLTACSSSNSPITPGSDDAGTTDNDSGSTGSGTDSGTESKDSGSTSKGKQDSGSSGGGDSSTACTVAPDWAENSPGPACDACELKNCCAAINNCENDQGCVAIFNCQNNCYSEDAGAPAGDGGGDGGSEDASGSTSQDTCAAACVTGTGASTASQNLFNTQDDCVNGNTCGAAAVCD